MPATLVSGLGSFQVSLFDFSVSTSPEFGLPRLALIFCFHVFLWVKTFKILTNNERRKRGTHAEGSTLGSLEFCTGALNTRLIFVLGHTNCGALKGATAAYLSQEKRANHALDVLLNELGSVVSDAKSQCGRNATADEIASKAVGVVGLSSWKARSPTL